MPIFILFVDLGYQLAILSMWNHKFAVSVQAIDGDRFCDCVWVHTGSRLHLKNYMLLCGFDLGDH